MVMHAAPESPDSNTAAADGTPPQKKASPGKQRSFRSTAAGAAKRGLKAPPRLSGGWGPLGHTAPFIRDTIGLLERAYAEGGEVVEFGVAHRRMVLLSGPAASEAMFRAPDEVLSPNEAYKIMVPVFGRDVAYGAPPKKMGEQLRMLLPALQDKRMRSYGEIIANEVRQALAEWDDEGELDIVEWTKVLTNFTSSHCLLGPEFRNEMTEEFAQVYHDLERGVTPIAYINPYLPLPSFRVRDKARVRLVEMISGIVEQRRESGREGEDFLQTLMDAQYKSGAPLSDHEITGMLLAAMFAGHHTSSVTTAWMLLELLTHPEYMQRLSDQLWLQYGTEEEISYLSLREISHTEWAVKETLRLHPPLFMLLRAAMKDWEFDGYHIPKGTYVVASPWVSHRISSVFPDAHAFDPDRFGPGREEDKQSFAFISFGGGRHKCMGNAFALLQVKTIFAILLREFEFELVGDEITSDFHGLVVGPKQPCRLRYRRLTAEQRQQRLEAAQARAAAAPNDDTTVHNNPGTEDPESENIATGCPVAGHGGGGNEGCPV